MIDLIVLMGQILASLIIILGGFTWQSDLR